LLPALLSTIAPALDSKFYQKRMCQVKYFKRALVLYDQVTRTHLLVSFTHCLYNFYSFDVRLEDIIYLTADGPAWFSIPADILEDPVGRMG
jgi:hypothetical protein